MPNIWDIIEAINNFRCEARHAEEWQPRHEPSESNSHYLIRKRVEGERNAAADDLQRVLEAFIDERVNKALADDGIAGKTQSGTPGSNRPPPVPETGVTPS